MECGKIKKIGNGYHNQNNVEKKHSPGDSALIWEEQEVEYALDGGSAWVIAAASLLNNFVLDGVSFSYGVLTQKVTEQKSLSEFQFHLCGSVMLGTQLIIGPMIPFLCSTLGFCTVSILGSVTAAVGFFLSWAWSWGEAPSFTGFLVGFGLLVGVGFGLMFTVSIIILGKFFASNLPFATGLAVTGSALGSLATPKVLGWIVGYYGWQGSMLFLSGCCIVSIGFGALYRECPTRVEKVCKVLADRKSDTTLLKELVKSPTCWILCVTGGLGALGYFMPSAFIADRAMAPPFNATWDQATWLPAIIGGSNTLARFGFGILANSDRAVYSLMLINVALTLGGFVTMMTVYATKYWMLALYAALYGQMIGVLASLRSVVVYQYMGKEKYSLAFGLNIFFMGISLYCGNAFAGWLNDTTGNMDSTFQYVGAFFILSALPCYPLRWIHEWETGRPVFSSALGSNS